MTFAGAKVALFCGASILTLRRDDRPGLPWPGLWDLPGGGREGDETPEACVLRELHEEFGLTLAPERLVWRRKFPSMTDASLMSVFFGGHLLPAEVSVIRFGDEGQSWLLMPVQDFLARPDVIGELQRRVRILHAEWHPTSA